MREYVAMPPPPTPTFLKASKLWMLLSYLLYLFLDQLTILIGLKVCGEEGEDDGENSDKNILFTSSQLEGGKTALLA